MNRGLLTKSLRETWMATLLFGAALFVVEAVFGYVLPELFDQFADLWLQAPFIRSIFKALTGTEMGENFGLLAVMSIAWVHPIVLALTWAQEMTFCSRTPAGEIDRGTIDVWLGLPVSRWQVYLNDTAIWLASGVVLIAFAWLGSLIGQQAAPPGERASAGRTMWVLVNFMSLYIAVGGLAYLCSACCDRRGRAIGIVLGIVLASFLLNFLAEFWAPAQKLAFLGVLNYYRPLPIVQQGQIPTTDIGTLLVLGATLWFIGAAVFVRRDIRTV